MFFPAALTPGTPATESGHYILAFRFDVEAPVEITGVRFVTGVSQTGTGVAIWSIGGARLAMKMQNLTSGTNTILFDTPLSLSAALPTEYLVGVLLPGPSVNYSGTPAGPTLSEGDLNSAGIGYFNDTATTLTLTNPPHIGGANDDGKFNWGGGNWYGISLILPDEDEEPLSPISFTAVRTSNTVATLTWTDPGDAPDGVTVLRAPGVHSVDGSGDAFGAVGYNPETIAGATLIAEGQESPFVNTGLDAGTSYTYAIIRTGPTP